MKQLTGIDASFLYMETPSTHAHVTGLMLLERPSASYDPLAAVHAKYASVVGAVEPIRRRVVEVPFGLDHPYWIDDPDFDLRLHIHHHTMTPPGRTDQLAEQVALIHGRPMDRSRPLWEVHVIEGLEDGGWALLTKYHHATIDGAAGQLMLEIMTETEADAAPPGESPSWEPEAIPTNVELLRRATENLVRNPLRATRVQARIVRRLADAAGIASFSGLAAKVDAAVRRIGQRREDQSSVVPRSTTPAPRTPWNKAISPHRRFAMRTASLEDIKRLKNATGATVNDVIMAICAGGLRSYLLRHDALPERPLRVMVPVSIRTGEESDVWTNRVSAVTADLPTDCADPLERVARCRDAMDAAKRQFEMLPAAELLDLFQFSSPALATAASRVSSQLRLSDHVDPPVNLVISNVPGPRQPLYFAGAKITHQFPLNVIIDGQGLSITVMSYLDRLDFGFVADRELLPDLSDLADVHIDEIGRLFDATGVERTEASQPSHARSARSMATRAPTRSPEKATAKTPVTTKAAARKPAKKKAPADPKPVKKKAAADPKRAKRPVHRDTIR